MARRLAMVGGGGLAGLALVALTTLPVDPWALFRPAPVLESDVSGQLAEVDIHYVRSFHDAAYPTIADLLGSLSPDTAVRIVVAREEEFDHLMESLDRDDIHSPHEITPVVMGMPISPWAKDRFGTLRRGDEALLALPPRRGGGEGPRANDERVPARLCEQLDDVSCIALSFAFEGGDLLSDDEHVFVPANLVARNPVADEEARRQLLEEIAEVTGRRVIPIGTSATDIPDHHIGMVVTPLGDGVLAVADPDLGRKLYERLPEDRRTVQLANDPAVLARFDNVAEALETRGFEIVPIPMLLTASPRVYVTYNNAVVETRTDGRHIHMPVYGIPALDDEAERRFVARGLQVHRIRVGSLYEHTGSLRCLVGVIRRS